MTAPRRRRRWNPNGLVREYANNRRIARLLASPEGDVIRARVDRGAEWLAARQPEWQTLIQTAVEDERFNLSECDRCAIGVTLGWYFTVTGEEGLTNTQAQQLGFYPIGMDYGAAPTPDRSELVWTATEQAWVDKVYGR